MQRRTWWASLVATALVVTAACGADDEPDVAETTVTTSAVTTTTPPTTSTNPEPTTGSTSTTSTTTASTTTSSTSTTTTAPTAPTAPPTLPGEAIDPMFTPAGAELGAVGVPFDDPLVLRLLPGDDQEAVTTLPPLSVGIVSTGRAQTLGVRSAWLEVTVAGEVGWLPMLNLLYVGDRTEDATDRFVELIGRVPQAPSMLELGHLVGESIAATDFEVPTRIVAVTEPFEGAIGEVTIDVLDLPDDSVGGQRLVIAGRALLDTEMTGSGTAGYELVSVEATPLCIRGAAADGLCP